MNITILYKQDLERGLKEWEYRLIIKLGVMLAAVIGILATIIKF